MVDLTQMPVVEERRRKEGRRGIDCSHTSYLSLREERKNFFREVERGKEDEKMKKERRDGERKEERQQLGVREEGVRSRSTPPYSHNLRREGLTEPTAHTGPRRSGPEATQLIPQGKRPAASKARSLLSLAVRNVEADVRHRRVKETIAALHRGRKRPEVGPVQRGTFFWDIQEMVVSSELGRGRVREDRRVQLMSKERAMGVLGLGVRKVRVGMVVVVVIPGGEGTAGGCEVGGVF